MCGIFGYINYKVCRKRSYIIQLLFNALRRLEYRGYDSAGISFDSSSFQHCYCDSDHNNNNGDVRCSCLLLYPLFFRNQGNVDALVNFVYEGMNY